MPVALVLERLSIAPRNCSMTRKPIAAAVVGTILIVVCDDGSVWELDPSGDWVERRPIPGTTADLAPARLEDEPPEATVEG
jgi:hypothetical protein